MRQVGELGGRRHLTSDDVADENERLAAEIAAMQAQLNPHAPGGLLAPLDLPEVLHDCLLGIKLCCSAIESARGSTGKAESTSVIFPLQLQLQSYPGQANHRASCSAAYVSPQSGSRFTTAMSATHPFLT